MLTDSPAASALVGHSRPSRTEMEIGRPPGPVALTLSMVPPVMGVSMRASAVASDTTSVCDPRSASAPKATTASTNRPMTPIAALGGRRILGILHRRRHVLVQRIALHDRLHALGQLVLPGL